MTQSFYFADVSFKDSLAEIIKSGLIYKDIPIPRFTDEETELVWNYFKGKPVYLVEAPKHRDELEEWCGRNLRFRVQSINALIHGKKSLLRLLKKFEDRDEIPFDGRVSKALTELVKANVSFVDLLNGVIRPQERLALLAIRDVLGVIE